MSYRVHSSHVEALHDGRTVAPGERVSDAVAKQNPRLVERGVLVKEAEPRKPAAKREVSGREPAKSPAPEQGSKEED